MVPSRSRKTAGLGAVGSGRRHLRKLRAHGGFYHFRRDCLHAAMVCGATPKETWTAVRFLLNQRRTRRDGSGALGIGWPEYSNNRKANSGSDMHCPRIVPQEQMALRQQGGQVCDWRFPRQVDGCAAQLAGDRRRDGGFPRGAEQNHVSVSLRQDRVENLCKAVGWPTLRRTIGS